MRTVAVAIFLAMLTGCVTIQSKKAVEDAAWEADFERRKQAWFDGTEERMKQAAAAEKQVAAKRAAEINTRTDWTEADRKNIIERKIHLGMTEEQCELSWGPPDKKRETKYTWGTTAQWIYSEKNLYFKDGRLETIQDR